MREFEGGRTTWWRADAPLDDMCLCLCREINYCQVIDKRSFEWIWLARGWIHSEIVKDSHVDYLYRVNSHCSSYEANWKNSCLPFLMWNFYNHNTPRKLRNWIKCDLAGQNISLSSINIVDSAISIDSIQSVINNSEWNHIFLSVCSYLGWIHDIFSKTYQ